MARWTTTAAGKQLQRKNAQSLKQSMKVYTSNKYMKGFTRLPQETATGGTPKANRKAPGQDAASHHLSKDDVAHFYARDQLKQEKLQRKQQTLAPRPLKGRGFSAVAAYAQERDYLRPDAVQPKGPVKPLKYDYTRLHPSWEAKMTERQRLANVFQAFQGAHVRIVEDPGCRVYIRGFPDRMANEVALKELFAPFGAVDNVKLHWSKALNGHFAFVDFDQTPAGERAAKELNGTHVDGQALVVHVKGGLEGPPPTPTPASAPHARHTPNGTPAGPRRTPNPKPVHTAARD